MFCVDIVLAVHGKNNGIALSDFPGLPWPKFKEDMKLFNKITTQNGNSTADNIIFMGRKTADTFKRPLKGRINVVLTSNSKYREKEGFISVDSFAKFLEFAKKIKDLSKTNNRNLGVFIIGGRSVINEYMKHKEYVRFIYITRINEWKENDKWIKKDLDIKLPSLLENAKIIYEHKFEHLFIKKFKGSFSKYRYIYDAD
jgi:dihydrofolate reductase